MKATAIATLGLVFAFTLHAQSTKPTESKEVAPVLEQSEVVAKQYLESFRKTGVPTSKAVAAAVEKAKQQASIEAWTDAAAIANAYANVVDVLTNHYSALYDSSRPSNSEYIEKARAYEKLRNRYFKIRNDAYIELAKLYAAKGDKAKALSFVVMAVKLSGFEPNTQGEALIKEYIGLEE